MSSKIRTNFAKLLTNRGESVTLIRETLTRDGAGEVSSVTSAETSITAILQALTEEERQYLGSGLQSVGDAKGYFKHDYNGTKILEGDIIKDSDGQKWRVEQIERKATIEGNESFRKAILHRID